MQNAIQGMVQDSKRVDHALFGVRQFRFNQWRMAVKCSYSLRHLR